jgi:branched-chain amino acid transport system permease protein
MIFFIQYLVDGLSAGSIYALIAVGFTLIIGVMSIVQMAHTDIMMCGTVISWILIEVCHTNYLIGFLGGVVAAGVLGLIVERIVIRPVRMRSFLAVFMTTIGLSMFIQNTAARFFGPQPHGYSAVVTPGGFHVGGVFVSSSQVITLALAASLMLGLKFFIERTRYGRAVRATEEDALIARAFGVNTTRVDMFIMVLASAIGGVAGILLSILYNLVWSFSGGIYALKGLVAMIVGGLGSLSGAFAAGLILGVAESLTIAYVGSSWRDAIGFGLLLLLLVIKPTGLAGYILRRG